MSPAAIDGRLRQASRLAGSLRPEHRLATKIDLTGAAVARRLREASDLLDLCRALARAGASARPSPKGAPPGGEGHGGA
jgi:hypothetical protein